MSSVIVVFSALTVKLSHVVHLLRRFCDLVSFLCYMCTTATESRLMSAVEIVRDMIRIYHVIEVDVIVV